MVNRYFPKNKFQMFWWWFAKSFLKLILPLFAPRNWSPYQLYEAQSEPSQTLKMELFAKIVNGFKLTLLTIRARAHTHTHTHTHTHARTHTQKHNFHFQHLIIFSIASSIFQDLLPNQTDIARILRNTSFHNRFSIWVVTSLKTTTRKYTYSSFLFLYLYI